MSEEASLFHSRLVPSRRCPLCGWPAPFDEEGGRFARHIDGKRSTSTVSWMCEASGSTEEEAAELANKPKPNPWGW